MKVTRATDQSRNKSKQASIKYATSDDGKQKLKENGKKHSEWIKTRPDLIELWTTHLKTFYGEEHHKFNPDRPEFLKYAYRVRQLTEQQYVLHIHEINPNCYPRTLYGVDGGYQLDHITSIKQGFDEGMSPETISHHTNLQMLPWQINLQKSINNNNILPIITTGV